MGDRRGGLSYRMYRCVYYDLRAGVRGDHISLLFPGWQPGEERVAILSPHDDDAVLGAGYLALAAAQAGGQVWVLICCDGRGGYSRVEEKETIIAVRRQETLAAYGLLDIPAERVVRYNFPDFGLFPRIGWNLPGGGEGTFAQNLRALRRIGVTRLLVPNGYREHLDHTAAYLVGAFDGPQVGDPTLADWGLAPPVRNTLIYSVWADFSPEDALVAGASTSLRANRALVAPAEMEERLAASLRAFRSQLEIIDGLLGARRGRFFDGGVVELYQAFDPRPSLDYRPYHARIREIAKAS